MNGAATRKALTDAAQARAEQLRAAVMREIPEAVAFIRDLHQAGLIEGWRNVVDVGPPREASGITADVFLATSAAAALTIEGV